MSEEEQIILPSGYTKLQWISAEGASYLQLPITTVAGDKVVLETNCKFNYLDNQAEGKNGNPYFFFGIKSGVWYCGAGNTGDSTTPADTDWHKIKLIHSSSDCGLYIDDNKILSQTYNSGNVLLDGTISVFKTSGGDYYCKNCKKYWKLYVNDELVYSLIPCLDNDGVPCMYDLVNDEVYYNEGTEQFNYPSSNYNLPAGFKKCVYLQSDGTQWINTGVIPDNETGLCFRALQLSYGDLVPFGVCEGNNYIYPPRFYLKDVIYKWGTSIVTMMTWDKADDLIFYSSLNLYNSKIAKFDSEDTDVEMSITSQTGTYTLPIWLFSYNWNGAFNESYGKWRGRIYRAQITQGADLIHDYVPCLDANGRPCMYDIIGGGTVEDNTYYNQSGGTEFTYCVEHQLPSDFIKLKYLESTGTQYIKTGYVPTNTTGLYIDTQDVGGGDTIPMGLRESSSTNTRFFITRQTSTHGGGYGWGTWTNILTSGSVRYDSTLNWLNGRKSITNNPLISGGIKNLGELPFTPSLDIWMFGINQGGSHAYKFKGRIYRAKISEGTEIVRDFVPARDERKLKLCMYDLINNVAYYNDGTGEFLYNRDFEGNYKGFTGLGCIGNRLGSDYNPINEKLPSGYTRIDFLEATGTQYITTDVYATGSMKFELEFLTKDFGGLSVLYGVFKYGEHSCFYNNYNNGYGHAGRFIYGSTYYYPVFKSEQFQVDTRYKLVVDGHEVYRNGDKMRYRIESGSTIVDSIEPLDFVTSLPISVFAHTGLLSRNSGIKRMYYFQASDNGEMKLNFIPAIDDKGKPCMFDLVTQQPYYNLGTGEDFRAGLKSMSHALQLYLPDSGGTITLSLPTNDNIEYYEEKIRANNPNWTITFQYH